MDIKSSMLIEQGKTRNKQFITIFFSMANTLLGFYLYDIGISLIIFPLCLGLLYNLFVFFIIKTRWKEYLTSFILTFLFTFSLTSIFLGNNFFLQGYLYIISLCIYHFNEYFFVLFYHYDDLKFASFLIDQSLEWGIATATSFVEYLIENFFFNKYKSNIILIIIGLCFMVTGHIFRIGALFTGKSNFTHLIAYKKKKEHVLVKHGIYAISRHPSYFGFFIWSVGTQVMCANPICIIGFTLVLFSFFKNRILQEEPLLIQFFGEDYIKYKHKVPILIPFIALTSDQEEYYLNIYKRRKQLEKEGVEIDEKNSESEDNQ